MADTVVRTKRNGGTPAPLPAPEQSPLCPRIWYNKVSKQPLRTIYNSVYPTQGILLFWSFYMVKNCHVTFNPLNLDLTKKLSLIISVRSTCQTDIKLIIHPVYPLVPRAAKKRQNKTTVWADTAAKRGRQRGESTKENKEPIKLQVLTWCFQQAHPSCPGSFGKRN